jgi:hypothetical protein
VIYIMLEGEFKSLFTQSDVHRVYDVPEGHVPKTKRRRSVA